MGDTGQPVLEEPQSSLCNCQSLTATSPVGACVCPLATSESVVRGTSNLSAISARVIPIGAARRSAMRERQEIDFRFAMSPSIRDPVCEMQRHAVTEFRHPNDMKAIRDHPGPGSHLGQRLTFWRRERKLSRQELYKKTKVAVTTLSEIENQRQHSSTKIPQLAEALQINPHYLATGEGHPLTMIQQVPPRHDWPEEFPPLDMIKGLDENERILAGKELKESVQQIISRRRRSSRHEA